MNMETYHYFNGPEEETIPPFSPEEYTASVSQKPIEEIEDLELTLVEEIDTDKENEFKKKNAPIQGVALETLPFNVQKAEELHALHEKQLEILKQIKKQKSGKKKSTLRSFLSF